MSKGRINRQKGHDAERFCRTVFIDLGFKDCITTRMGSKYYDDSKIDLMNIPFNVQVKAGIQKGMNPCKVLEEMYQGIENSKLPLEVIGYERFFIFIKQIGRGRKERPEHKIVYMESNLFDRIRDSYPELKEMYPCDSRKFNKVREELQEVVGVPLLVFKNYFKLKHL